MTFTPNYKEKTKEVNSSSVYINAWDCCMEYKELAAAVSVQLQYRLEVLAALKSLHTEKWMKI